MTTIPWLPQIRLRHAKTQRGAEIHSAQYKITTNMVARHEEAGIQMYFYVISYFHAITCLFSASCSSPGSSGSVPGCPWGELRESFPSISVFCYSCVAVGGVTSLAGNLTDPPLSCVRCLSVFFCNVSVIFWCVFVIIYFMCGFLLVLFDIVAFCWVLWCRCFVGLCMCACVCGAFSVASF